MYVFKNLENNNYIMCTKLPNWQTPDVEIGDEGFLKYESVKAGESYYDPESGEAHIYKYSNVYFLNFVKKTEIVNDTIIL